MKIEITDADIDNGRPGNAFECPIAMAVKRICPDWRDVTVDGDVIRIVRAYPEVHALPIEAKQFIVRFDDKFPVFPFTFETL